MVMLMMVRTMMLMLMLIADADALYNFRRGKTSRFSGIWTNGETQYDHICRELLCTCIFFK